MKEKTKTALIISLVLALLFLFAFAFWQALKPSLDAIHYLESKGYSSVRILYGIPKGRGCSPDDVYRRVFDAIPPGGEQRVESNVCGDGESVWYEEE